jgi:protein ImuA
MGGNEDETPLCGSSNRTPDQLIEALREQIARLEGQRRPPDSPPVSSGCEALDRLLPGRGFRRGTLVEWLEVGEAGAVQTLALIAARQACQDDGVLVVLDPSREFYPPAAARLGIALERLIVVQAASMADNLWALDQALRCPAVAAALAWPATLDGRTFRRLQLAAEQGGSLGLLIRPEAVRREPSWAVARLLVEPLPSPPSAAGRRLRIQVLRSRGSSGARGVEVEIDDETSTVHLAPPRADPTACRRSARA